MRIKSLVGMVIFGLVAFAFAILRSPGAAPSEAAERPLPEKPWLSREAAEHMLGPWGTPGPLFVGVTLGGAPPPREIRDAITAYARANDVTIGFEVADDELVAMTFDVTFGGCCGYEGIDALAARLGRPTNGGGCGMPSFYYDHWAMAADDGTHVRGTVRVNRLTLRWQRTLSIDEVLARADQLLGSDRGDALKLETGKYLVELPYNFANTGGVRPARGLPGDRGIQLFTDHRIVTALAFAVVDEAARERFAARWGKPRVDRAGNTWTWHRRDRTIVAALGYPATTVTISRR